MVNEFNCTNLLYINIRADNSPPKT